MSDERNARKVYQGRVVSDKMDKTITVVIDTYKSAQFYAHDENNEAHVGDTVQIMETRPLSAKKRFRLVKVVEKAVIL